MVFRGWRALSQVSNPFTTPGAELDATSPLRKLIIGNLVFPNQSIFVKQHYPCFTPGKLMHMLVMAKTKGISFRSVGKTADSQRFKPQFVKCQARTVTTEPVFLSSRLQALEFPSWNRSQIHQSHIGTFKG